MILKCIAVFRKRTIFGYSQCLHLKPVWSGQLGEMSVGKMCLDTWAQGDPLGYLEAWHCLDPDLHKSKFYFFKKISACWLSRACQGIEKLIFSHLAWSGSRWVFTLPFCSDLCWQGQHRDLLPPTPPCSGHLHKGFLLAPSSGGVQLSSVSVRGNTGEIMELSYKGNKKCHGACEGGSYTEIVKSD